VNSKESDGMSLLAVPPSTASLEAFVGGSTGVAEPAVRHRTVWTVITGAVGGAVGLAPHVLHHIGPLVGTALVAGAGGTVVFGGIGLVASVPMLVKLRRRFSNWWAPAIALGVFTAMFLISTFVVGPLISAPDAPGTPAVTDVGHSAHHD
jgi:hypothetical protein